MGNEPQGGLPSRAGVPPRRRLFFALWPTDEMRQRIERETRALVAAGESHPIAPDNYHVTLLFLGAVAASHVDAIVTTAVQISAHPFDLTLDRVEYWPDSSVLCLAASRTPPALVALAEQLHFKLSAQTLPLPLSVATRPDANPAPPSRVPSSSSAASSAPVPASPVPALGQHRPRLRAHVTLARGVSSSQPSLPVAPLRWPVQEFVLLDSVPAAGGSRYSILGRWPL
jgi:2'-5' RNA ligase